MGGFTGLIYALKYQQTLSALVLDSTAASHLYRDDPNSVWPEARATEESIAFRENPSQETVGPFFTRIRDLEGSPAPRPGTEAWMNSMEMNPHALGEILNRISEFDTRLQLSEIRIPTLVLSGELDRQCPPSQARIIAEGIPGSVLKVYPDTGHGVIRARPSGAMDAFKEFVDSAQARR